MSERPVSCLLAIQKPLSEAISESRNLLQSEEGDIDQFGITSKVSLTTIANLLGLNSPRGTSLGNTSMSQFEDAGPYASTPPMSGVYRDPCDMYPGPMLMTPPVKTKRFFETPPSPDYSGHEAAAVADRAKRSLRGFSDCDSPPQDKGLPIVGSGTRSGSPTDSGIGLGNSLPDNPRFMDNINDLMGKMCFNSPESNPQDHQDYVRQQDYSRLPARGRSAYASGASGVMAMPYMPLPLNQMAMYHHHHQMMMSQMFDKQSYWLSHQMMAGAREDNATSLERAARYHRTAAAMCDATCTWSGVLPPRNLHDPNSVFSCKVFLGGVPWDMTEGMLFATFRQFGNVRIEWPGKETSGAPLPKGFVYVIFENDKQVRLLLQACTREDLNDGGQWYYKISSRKMKAKDVQVIPWLLTDSNCIKCSSLKLDPQKTVFVGALHGMMNAEGLSHIMNELFENVIYAGIDTDKYKYPIGSGRVTFSNPRSYMRAVAAAFIEIKTVYFSKKVQVDPYLEDALCSMCQIQQGPYFCREMTCFRYFCRSCWQWHHSSDSTRSHKPLMRNSKSTPVNGFSAGPRGPK